MRKFSQKISAEELNQKLIAAWHKHEEHTHYDDSNDYEYHLTWLTSQIENDLKKVSFDNENCDKQEFVTLSNGLVALPVRAGGDWEMPIVFFVYWDGRKLRAYIPTDGNLWNTATKEAYGNNEESDLDNGRKRGFIPEGSDEIDWELADMDKMVQDFESRIEFKG